MDAALSAAGKNAFSTAKDVIVVGLYSRAIFCLSVFNSFRTEYYPSELQDCFQFHMKYFHLAMHEMLTKS